MSDKEFIQKAKDYAVRDFLGLKNSEWLDENEKFVTAQEFMDRLEPECVERDKDTVTVWFGDGGLFFGHSIYIEFDAEGKYKHSDLCG